VFELSPIFAESRRIIREKSYSSISPSAEWRVESPLPCEKGKDMEPNGVIGRCLQRHQWEGVFSYI